MQCPLFSNLVVITIGKKDMETLYTWNTRLFSSTHEIFNIEGKAGELSTFSLRNAEGELEGKKVLFTPRGFFKREILIKIPDEESPVGSIIPGGWGNSARITLRDRDYMFRFESFFHTRWSISDINETLIRFTNTFKSRGITAFVKDEILILAGLYLKDYFRKRAAAASASV